MVGIVQCTRIFMYKQSQKSAVELPAAVEQVKEDLKDVVKS